MIGRILVSLIAFALAGFLLLVLIGPALALRT
jgi:hypothetical protein